MEFYQLRKGVSVPAIGMGTYSLGGKALLKAMFFPDSRVRFDPNHCDFS